MTRNSSDDAAPPPNQNDLADRLVAYDESLRQGEFPIDLGLTRDAAASDPEATELMDCLDLLELVWPRAATSLHPEMPTQIGRFQLERALGVGGFGIVYKAYDPLLRREIALKIPRLHSLADEKLRARFEKEALAAAALDHPNIVPIYETGHAGSISYIASAYCPGPNLAQWLKDQKVPVPLRMAATLVGTLAQAVHYSHSRNVLHRDLKPSNVMLDSDAMTPTDPLHVLPFVPRLTDFGVAKTLTDDCPGTTPKQETLELGTPIYMAPELTGKLGLPIGPATDVYGLGVILYELLTGRPPYSATNLADLFQQIRTSEPVAPRRLRPEIPIDLETICLKCLEKNPDTRFSSAKELADELDRYLRFEPIESRPVGYAGHFLRWCRRRPAMAALAGVSTAAVFTILVLLGAYVLLLDANNRNLTSYNSQISSLNANLMEAARHALALRNVAEENERQAKDLLYVADIGRAGAALKNEDTRALTELLERHVPKPGEIDRRGFEWRYLRQQSRRAARVLLDVGSPLYILCPSPDHSLLGTAGKDATVRLFDPLSGAIAQEIATGQIEVNGLAFSPDGKELATAGDDGTIRLWNLASGQERLKIAAHPGKAFQLLFTPDGREIISCGDDPVIRVFDPLSGELRRQLTAHRREVQSLVMGVSGKTFASAGSDGIAMVWDLPDWKPHHDSFGYDNNAPMGPIVLREDRDFVIVGADLRDFITIRISKNASSGTVKDLEKPESLALHPNGSVLASGNKSGRIRLWNVDPQGEITPSHLSPWQGHRGNVWYLVWSADGSRLISTGDDGRVMSWDPQANHIENPRRIDNPKLSGGFCLIPQTGCLLIAEDSDANKGSMILDWRTASEVSRMDGIAFHDAAASPDGRFIAGIIGRHENGEFRQDLELFEVQRPANGPWALRRVANWKSSGNLASLRFSPDSSRLALSYWQRPDPEEPQEHFVRLLGLPDLTAIETIPVPHAKAIAFSPDGKQVALATNVGLTLWDLGGRRIVWEVLQRDLTYLTFSPDGSLVVTGGDDRLVVVRNTSDGSIRFRLAGHRSRLCALTFSPAGRTLATADQEGSLRFWNVRVGQEALEIPHPGFTIQSLEFSADSQNLLLKGYQAAEATPQANSILIFEAPIEREGQGN